ncbi:hypothetical protein SAMN05421805_105221 [Saccharopolyspora antimicrobica]|uniref:Integral membrane protein n=1 Tax=Saccharopolyspora antimicrobica TaxID=455193 RepID=A0A1I5A2Z7_9PSEU|nr:hypothetical protein [Saccharopolyspora antimicrobica]RKT83294.1 hypothetical protein ATL45_1575 [Saccharopolyspora antimicrobica]SFN56872.1 hypothetical protein SAMN05421805_105221 [Saccharopolyspora antimicrobica]
MQRQTIAALTACLGGLAYTTSKVLLAMRAELGIHGFPAPASSYAAWQPEQIALAQLGNAAVGLVTAICALLLLWDGAARVRAFRWPLIVVSWLGIAMMAAGVVGFSLRAFGVVPALGPPAVGWSTYSALAVGAVWVVSWAIATVGFTRGRRLTTAG